MCAPSGLSVVDFLGSAVQTSQWANGPRLRAAIPMKAADIGTGYGTSFPRMGLTLLAVWLGFALVYGQAGAVIHTHGLPVSWIDLLSFSAATLTPIDAYPLATTSALGRTAMLVESVMGIGLLGALGHMVALRLNAD